MEGKSLKKEKITNNFEDLKSLFMKELEDHENFVEECGFQLKCLATALVLASKEYGFKASDFLDKAIVNLIRSEGE